MDGAIARKRFAIFNAKYILTKALRYVIIHLLRYGEMSERFKEPVLKTGDPKGPRVRIPLSPPISLITGMIQVFHRHRGEVLKW